MTKNHHAAEALKLLDQAGAALPQEAQIPAIRGAVLELSGKTDDALGGLGEAQHRWPESAAIRAAQGIILAAHQHPEEGRKALETAVALGAHSPEVWYALAESSLRAGPAQMDAAKAAIGQALKIAPDDAQVRALAARINGGTVTGPGNGATDPAKLFLTRPPADW